MYLHLLGFSDLFGFLGIRFQSLRFQSLRFQSLRLGFDDSRLLLRRSHLLAQRLNLGR